MTTGVAVALMQLAVIAIGMLTARFVLLKKEKKLMSGPKSIPPDDPDYSKSIDGLNWRLSGMLREYTRMRELLQYLRKAGYLSDLTTDHELARDYVISSSKDDATAQYFATIVKEQPK